MGARCCAALRERLRDRAVHDDPKLEMKQTALVVQASTGLFLALAGGNAFGATSDETSWAGFALLVASVSLNISAATLIFVRRDFAPWQVAGWLLPLGIVAIAGDWATLGTVDSWTLEVLIMDGLLAFGAPFGVSRLLLSLTVLWLVLRSLQESYDYGLWSPILAHSGRYEPYMCPRKDPSLGLSAMLFRVSVFVFDYRITRGFATTMMSQYESMKASQSVTEALAVLLSQYQVEEAQAAVEGTEGDQIPPPLREAFRTLLINLQTYKPYLPQHCLPNAASETSGSRLPTDSDEDSALSTIKSTGGSQLSSPRGRATSHNAVEARASANSTSTPIEAALSPPTGSLSLARGAVRAAPIVVKISILCTNRRGFLHYVQARGAVAVQQLEHRDVDRFSQLVSSHKGVVDTLNGDHFRSSFNAARQCASHRLYAARAAAACSQLNEPRISDSRLRTSAVCCGNCLVGDFGSATIVRYMIIGSPANAIGPIERLAAAWRAKVLVDGAVHADVAQTWFCRLRCSAVFPKLGHEREFPLWQLYGQRSKDEGEPEEWMYELDAMQQDPFTPHTAATKLWLAGSTAQAAAVAAQGLDSPADAHVSEAAHSALQQLLDMIAAGQPPPAITLIEGGGQLRHQDPWPQVESCCSSPRASFSTVASHHSPRPSVGASFSNVPAAVSFSVL
eukprot:TRINITY_DN13529_c0_g1_i1.p1 TRINITY_DN13529_c0_g1~~TRINITY_DN13529_c0_g1_i1.p1  ORF type:complete len:699 (+),score=129.14 TRINITY_DN13529_c0_g1_i1:66-2099(+)